MLKKIALFFVVIWSFSGCLKTPASKQTCTYDECAVKAPDAEIEKVQAYLTANSITATKHCSGVFYQIINAGTGKTASPCRQVAVRYKGMLTNGNVFDEQTTAVTFDLGNLIRGWTNTIPLIKEGGSMNLYIPPSLGYGTSDVKDRNGAVVIPANSILIFNIQLDAAQ